MASEIFPHLKIPLEDIVKATNNFHPDNKIGHGDFGTVYEGQLLRCGELMKVVARRLDRKHGLGGFEFLTEVSTLSSLKHTNIVSIIGFCEEKGKQIIVTTYEANGSLERFLNNLNLSWTQRLRICVGVARALSYLHSGEGRGYGVIQSQNQMGHVIPSEPIGTMGYFDPAIIKAKGVTYKSDIYSFGIVLFEILCGRKAYLQNEPNKFLDSLAKFHYKNKTLQNIIHPDIWKQMSPKSFLVYSKVAYSCLEDDLSLRPADMNYIVAQLEKALKVQMRRENIVNTLKHLKIPLDDIKLATDNFSKEYMIRHLGYYILYRAQLNHFDNKSSSTIEGKNTGEPSKRDNTVVIKRMSYADGEKFLSTEIEMLVSVKHSNIATLLGFCVESDEMIVVTDNVANGYLSNYLGDIYYERRRMLSWEKRLKICIDVANALNYLNYEMENKKIIINHNLNSDIIGLDENWGAKIVEFGFSVFLPPNQVDEGIHKKTYHSQRCHADPVWADTMKLKRESEVYSFGVVLFEILCGRMADDPVYLKKNNKGLAPLARQCISTETLEEMIDPLIKEETCENNFISHKGPDKDSLETFIKIANQCVAQTQNQRPTMEVVIKELKKALSFQEDRVPRADINNQSVNKLETTLQVQLARETIPEERVESTNTSENANKPEKALEVHLTHEISGKNEHLRIHLDDIKHATGNFSETSKLAFGGYFSLYRVQLDHFDIEHPIYGTIKRIHPEQQMYTEEHFYREIEVLTSVKHPNIVTLLGFCVEGSEMILLIDDLSNSHLVDCLKEVNQYKHILTWEKRLKICIDIAHALNYLHSEMKDKKMIINRYISSNHIGLNTNWEPKIVEFGYSIYLRPNLPEEALYLNNIVGLKYSVDPVYQTCGRLKRESDVYSFGVLLFEILCGRTANDAVYVKENVKGLAHVAIRGYEMGTLESMIDPIIKAETSENNFVLIRGPNKDSLYTFFRIAYQCLTEKQDKRPSMKVVLQELKKALSLQINNKNNPIISLKDIKIATNNFSDCIGGGGFGKAYKGNLKYGDEFKTIVAKRLDKSSDQGEEQFLNEIQILLEYKHENIIGLIGYCNEQDEKIIVYEYAPRGSLDRYLTNASLTWVQRLNICIDVARALDFFHEGVGKQAKVIHRDIKSENILLNHDWKAKLADFGLSLISSITQESDYIINRACGTPGYVDPVYSNLRFLTRESDIYSFGVVLFEILCGRSTFAIKTREGHHLVDFVETKFKEGKHEDVVFEQIREQIGPKSLATFQMIAYQCISHRREKRPTAKKVLRELKNALEFLNMESAIPECAPLQIPLEDLVNATDNFNHDNIIGHDAFGPIYKGRLLSSGNLINITARRLDRQHGLGDLEFWTEVTTLSDLKHTNLVSIIGFCDQEDERVIVATHEVNGSLHGYLNNPSLTWKQRLRISIGVARALSYLHYNEGRDYYFIHRFINSSAILLDQNWEAKLSNFEYSIKQFYKDKVRFCEPIGATWYMDPSVEKTGGVTHKSDIYSFGVVLFEILSGKEASTKIGFKSLSLTQLAKYNYEKGYLNSMVLSDLCNQVSPQSLLVYSNVAHSCLEEEPEHRPDMGYVVAELEKALSLQLSEAKSDYVEENSNAYMIEKQILISHSGELNSMTMPGKSGNLEIPEEMILPDHTNEQSVET